MTVYTNIAFYIYRPFYIHWKDRLQTTFLSPVTDPSSWPQGCAPVYPTVSRFIPNLSFLPFCRSSAILVVNEAATWQRSGQSLSNCCGHCCGPLLWPRRWHAGGWFLEPRSLARCLWNANGIPLLPLPFSDTIDQVICRVHFIRCSVPPNLNLPRVLIYC